MGLMGVLIASVATLEAQRALCVYGRRSCVHFPQCRLFYRFLLCFMRAWLAEVAQTYLIVDRIFALAVLNKEPILKEEFSRVCEVVW